MNRGRYLRIIGVEFLLKLVAGARGDFVNTWTSNFNVINDFGPLLYLDKFDTDLLAPNTVTTHRGALLDMLMFSMFS